MVSLRAQMNVDASNVLDAICTMMYASNMMCKC